MSQDPNVRYVVGIKLYMELSKDFQLWFQKYIQTKASFMPIELLNSLSEKVEEGFQGGIDAFNENQMINDEDSGEEGDGDESSEDSPPSKKPRLGRGKGGKLSSSKQDE